MVKRPLLCVVLLLSYLVPAGVFFGTVAAANGWHSAGGNETPAERDQRMKWWREARFGMFIHWGHCSQRELELSWPLVGGSSALPAATRMAWMSSARSAMRRWL